MKNPIKQVSAKLQSRVAADTARRLTEEHGEDAWLIACKTQLEMRKKKDTKAAALWREIAHILAEHAETKGSGKP